MQKYLVLTLVVCMLPTCEASVWKVEVLIFYAEFLHATFFQFLQCECFMRAEVRRGSKEVFIPLSGLQIRGGYYNYQECKSRVGIVHGGKLEGGAFWRAISSRWIEDVKRGVRVKTGEWKEVQMSRIWNWRQAPGSFVFCARRKSFVYIFWWLLHHATERGVVLSLTQHTLEVLYMDLVLPSSLDYTLYNVLHYFISLY